MYFDHTILFAFISVPCIVLALFAWKLHQWTASRKQQAAAQKQRDFLVIKGLGAAISLGEATAKAVQQLPVECNGEMSRALDYARDAKREQKEFLFQQGIENLH